ncbi:MAG: hypothetical protein R2729_11750 [Bryobacteraceae bacterium]
MKLTTLALLTAALAVTAAAREPKTRTSSGAWNKTTTRGNGERTTSATATNSKGETATRGTRTTANGDGAASYEGDATGFKGRSVHSQGTITRTETGRVNEGTYETSGGKSGSYTRRVTHAGENSTKTREAKSTRTVKR